MEMRAKAALVPPPAIHRGNRLLGPDWACVIDAFSKSSHRTLAFLELWQPTGIKVPTCARLWAIIVLKICTSSANGPSSPPRKARTCLQLPIAYASRVLASQHDAACTRDDFQCRPSIVFGTSVLFKLLP